MILRVWEWCSTISISHPPGLNTRFRKATLQNTLLGAQNSQSGWWRKSTAIRGFSTLLFYSIWFPSYPFLLRPSDWFLRPRIARELFICSIIMYLLRIFFLKRRLVWVIIVTFSFFKIHHYIIVHFFPLWCIITSIFDDFYQSCYHNFTLFDLWCCMVIAYLIIYDHII